MSKTSAQPPAYEEVVKPAKQAPYDPYAQGAQDTSDSVGAMRDLWNMIGLPQPKQTKTGDWFRRNIGDNTGWLVDGFQDTRKIGEPDPSDPGYDDWYRGQYEAGNLVPWAPKPKPKAPYYVDTNPVPVGQRPVDMSWLGLNLPRTPLEPAKPQAQPAPQPVPQPAPPAQQSVVPFIPAPAAERGQPQVGMPDMVEIKRMFDSFYKFRVPSSQQVKDVLPPSYAEASNHYPNAPFYHGSKSASSYFPAPPPAYPDTAREVRSANRNSLREGIAASREPPPPRQDPPVHNANMPFSTVSDVANQYQDMYGQMPRWVPKDFVGPLMPHQRRRRTASKKKKKKSTTKKRRGVPGYQVYKPMNLVAGRISGRGDYTVSNTGSVVRKNTVVNMGTQIPAFGDMSFATIVRHREFIQDISADGSTAFTNIAFGLNPGLSDTFPWLAQIAINYDQYQFMGVVFEFRTTSSDTATGLAMGSIIMATDYDSAEANYTTKQQMENSQYCTSAKPSQSFMHAIECDPGATSTPIKYVRGASQPPNTDIRTYDHGKFQIATVGLPVSSGNLGELWVSYEVALYKPQLHGLVGADMFNLGATWASPANTGGFGTTAAIAQAKLAITGSNLGWTLSGVNTLLVPAGAAPGIYSVFYKWLGASTALTNALTFTLGTGLSLSAIQSAGTASQSGAASGETAVQQWCYLTIEIVARLTVAAAITITAGTLPGTPVAGNVVVQQLVSNMIGT